MRKIKKYSLLAYESWVKDTPVKIGDELIHTDLKLVVVIRWAWQRSVLIVMRGFHVRDVLQDMFGNGIQNWLRIILKSIWGRYRWDI